MGHLRIKRVAMGWPGGLVASWPGHSSRLAESGRLVRRMSHHVDPAAIAEEARTVRLDAVLGPPRRSVPVGDSSTPESRTRGRFRVVGCGAFRLDFDGGLGGEAEETALFLPVMRRRGWAKGRTECQSDQAQLFALSRARIGGRSQGR